MRILLQFARSDPRRCVVTLLCLSLAAAAEGLGLSALLPLLGLAARASSGAEAPEAPASELERAVLDALARVGLEPTVGVLLGTALTAVTLKGALTLLAKREVGYAVAQVATDLRLRLVHALLATRWPYFTSQPVGAIANAFATEAKRSSETFLSGTALLAEGIALLVYAGVALATSSLDERSEAELWATLARLRGRTTLLAISHRPAVLAVADRVYRLEEARAVEMPVRR